METVYFGLGALTVMVVILITGVVMGVIKLKNVLQELRDEREIRRELNDNIWREFQNVDRNVHDEVSGIHRLIDSRYDQLRNYVDKK